MDVSVDEIMKWGSLSGKQFWSKIKKDWSLNQDIESLIASYDYEKEMSYYADIGLMPGTKKLFMGIVDEGLKIDVATSAEQIRIDRVLELGDLSRYVSSIVGAGDVMNHKPDPECYIKSCANLGSKPGNCLVIEDSSNGAMAAKGAGCMVAAFIGSMWEHDSFNADLYINDFREINSIQELTAQQDAPAGPADAGP